MIAFLHSPLGKIDRFHPVKHKVHLKEYSCCQEIFCILFLTGLSDFTYFLEQVIPADSSLPACSVQQVI